MLVYPAVSRWPMTLADGGHLPRGESHMAWSLPPSSHPQCAVIQLSTRLAHLRAPGSERQNIELLGFGYSGLEMQKCQIRKLWSAPVPPGEACGYT